MEQRVRCLFQPIPGVGDVEEGGKQISCYGGAPTNLLEQGDCLQAFLMSLVQLSSVYICSGQPGHHPERHQVVPCLADPLLRRTQPSHQEGTVLLERQGQPEGEGERKIPYMWVSLQLIEERMRDAPIDNMNMGHVSQGLQTGRDFRDHPTINDAFIDQGLGLCSVM